MVDGGKPVCSPTVRPATEYGTVSAPRASSREVSGSTVQVVGWDVVFARSLSEEAAVHTRGCGPVLPTYATPGWQEVTIALVTPSYVEPSDLLPSAPKPDGVSRLFEVAPRLKPPVSWLPYIPGVRPGPARRVECFPQLSQGAPSRLFKSMQVLTACGILLGAHLRAEGAPVIESFPGAMRDIMGMRKGLSRCLLEKAVNEYGLIRVAFPGICFPGRGG
jgi:hypothetical protein